MEEKTVQKSGKGWIKKVITILIIIAVAWLLGQLVVPAVLKALFL